MKVIMFEEFYGKISRSGSNLSDNLGDKLTGDFFGTLRHMDFCDGLQPILRGALRKSEKQQETSQDAIQLLENVNCTKRRVRSRAKKPRRVTTVPINMSSGLGTKNRGIARCPISDNATQKYNS